MWPRNYHQLGSGWNRNRRSTEGFLQLGCFERINGSNVPAVFGLFLGRRRVFLSPPPGQEPFYWLAGKLRRDRSTKQLDT
jgi:hypothetical protein